MYRFLLFICVIIISLTAHAQQINQAWYESLPSCPCNDPDRDSVRLNDGWAKDKGNFKKYHPGAESSYRSYPAVRTTEGLSGQQCCYDAGGKLITSGPAAGTPDKVSTCRGENGEGNMKTRLLGLWGHYFKDVRPWIRLGWLAYNEEWKPDQGQDCDN